MTVRVWYSGPEAEAAYGLYAEAFASHFGRGERPPLTLHGVCGRVLRGVDEHDFASLSSDPLRRVVLLLDAAALLDLPGRTGAEVLARIGYTSAEMRAFLTQGVRFRLALVPEVQAEPATWANVLSAAAIAYPQWAQRLAAARPTLEALPYSEIMRRGGLPAEVRAFLEQVLHLNPLFAGDGFTRCNERTTYAEYVCLNRPLSALTPWCQIEFPVTLP